MKSCLVRGRSALYSPGYLGVDVILERIVILGGGLGPPTYDGCIF